MRIPDLVLEKLKELPPDKQQAVLAPTVLPGADPFDARRIAAYRRGARRGPYRHQLQPSAR